MGGKITRAVALDVRQQSCVTAMTYNEIVEGRYTRHNLFWISGIGIGRLEMNSGTSGDLPDVSAGMLFLLNIPSNVHLGT